MSIHSTQGDASPRRPVASASLVAKPRTARRTRRSLPLWASAGRDPLLAEFPAAETRFRILGTLILVVAALAFGSSLYFMVGILNAAWYFAVVVATLWAGFILTLDRAFVAVTSSGWMGLAVRIVVAVVVGMTFAEPIVLAVFDSSIEVQVATDRRRAAGDAVQDWKKYDAAAEPLKRTIDTAAAALAEAQKLAPQQESGYVAYRKQVAGAYDQMTAADAAAAAEAKGAAGRNLTGIVGYGPAYEAKRAIAERKRAEWQALVDQEPGQLAAARDRIDARVVQAQRRYAEVTSSEEGSAKSRLAALEATKAALQKGFDTSNSRADQLGERMKALRELQRKEPSTLVYSVVLQLLLVVAEVSAVLAKHIMSRDSEVAIYVMTRTLREREAACHAASRVVGRPMTFDAIADRVQEVVRQLAVVRALETPRVARGLRRAGQRRVLHWAGHNEEGAPAPQGSSGFLRADSGRADDRPSTGGTGDAGRARSSDDDIAGEMRDASADGLPSGMIAWEQVMARDPQVSSSLPSGGGPAVEQVADRVLGGRFRLHRDFLHTNESFGSNVYRADDFATGRTVVVKIYDAFKVGVNTDRLGEIERFAERGGREYHLLAALDGSGVTPRAIADGREEGTGFYWFAQEDVDGKPLEELLGTENAGLFESLQRAAELAEAVARIHAAGIYHRDLKPSNIIVRASDDRPVLIDFGMSTDIPVMTSGSLFSTAVGTPYYASLEFIEKCLSMREITVPELVDIHSLGVIIYRMLTGLIPRRAPGDGGDLLAIARRPVDIRPLLGAGAPPDLAATILAALDHDPARRFGHEHPETAAASLWSTLLTYARGRHPRGPVDGQEVVDPEARLDRSEQDAGALTTVAGPHHDGATRLMSQRDIPTADGAVMPTVGSEPSRPVAATAQADDEPVPSTTAR